MFSVKWFFLVVHLGFRFLISSLLPAFPQQPKASGYAFTSCSHKHLLCFLGPFLFIVVMNSTRNRGNFEGIWFSKYMHGCFVDLICLFVLGVWLLVTVLDFV